MITKIQLVNFFSLFLNKKYFKICSFIFNLLIVSLFSIICQSVIPGGGAYAQNINSQNSKDRSQSTNLAAGGVALIPPNAASVDRNSASLNSMRVSNNNENNLLNNSEESIYYGSKIPQTYEEWAEHYKLKYMFLNCPSKTCLFKGIFELSMGSVNIGGESLDNISEEISDKTDSKLDSKLDSKGAKKDRKKRNSLVKPQGVESDFYILKTSGYSYFPGQKIMLAQALDAKGVLVWPENISIKLNGKNYNASYYTQGANSFVSLGAGEWEIAQTFGIGQALAFVDTFGTYSIFNNKTHLLVDYTGSRATIRQLSKDFSKINKNNNVDLKNETQLKPDAKRAGPIGANVFRFYSDTRPASLQTQIQITYVGVPGEVKIGKIIPPNFLLTSYESPVPIRLDSASGEFYALLNPGTWTIKINASSQEAVAQINTAGLFTFNLNSPEIWSIQNIPTIRQFEVLGENNKSSDTVDPQRVYVPGEWKKYNSYRINREINFKTVTRNLSDINTDTLKSTTQSRTTWIGLDKKALNVEEVLITNDKNSDAAILNPNVQVESAAIDNKPQLIFKDKNKEGKENSAIGLNPGKNVYNLVYVSDNSIPLSVILGAGVNKINSWTINLSPRTRIFAYTGVDKISGSWVDNWNLYAIFGLFLITLSFYKLFGLTSAALCFISILINIQNSFFSWTAWPIMLICMALIKVLTRERLSKNNKEEQKEQINGENLTSVNSDIMENSAIENSVMGKNEKINDNINDSNIHSENNTEIIISDVNKSGIVHSDRFVIRNDAREGGLFLHSIRAILILLFFGFAFYSCILTLQELRYIINPSLEAENFYVNQEDKAGFNSSVNNVHNVNNGQQVGAAKAMSSLGISPQGPGAQDLNFPSMLERNSVDNATLKMKEEKEESLFIEQAQESQKGKNQVSSGGAQWHSVQTYAVQVSSYKNKDSLVLYVAPVWLVNIVGIFQVLVSWLICVFIASFIIFNGLIKKPLFLENNIFNKFYNYYLMDIVRKNLWKK